MNARWLAACFVDCFRAKQKLCCVLHENEAAPEQMNFCFCVRVTTNRYYFVKAYSVNWFVFHAKFSERTIEARGNGAGEDGDRIGSTEQALYCKSSNNNNSVNDNDFASKAAAAAMVATIFIMKTNTSVSVSSPSQSLEYVQN